MSILAARRFTEELNALLQKSVCVITSDGREFRGTLLGFDPETFSLCLGDAVVGENRFPRLFINGNNIVNVCVEEEPFDLKGLAERLERVFPKMVRLHEEAGVIVVMDKIRVTEKGIVEGSGPAAERVQKVYEEFVKEHSKE